MYIYKTFGEIHLRAYTFYNYSKKNRNRIKTIVALVIYKNKKNTSTVYLSVYLQPTSISLIFTYTHNNIVVYIIALVFMGAPTWRIDKLAVYSYSSVS